MQGSENIQLFDTHCHLDFAQFEGMLPAHLEQAERCNVRRFLIPSVGPSNWLQLGKISSRYANVYHALGFHPYFLSTFQEQQITQLEALFMEKQKNCVAVGECGLDALINVDMKTQEQYLLAQFNIAQNLQLPLILHCRKAQNRLLQLLKAHRIDVGGVIHGFSGSYQQAMAFVELGFKIGVGGTITYPRANKTRKAVTQLSVQHLVLETDAPDMPMYGLQGQSNHPKHLPIVLDVLSSLKNESRESIAISVWENSNQIFKIYV